MQTNEFRVRPVTRFVLTHYQEGADGRTGTCRDVGEFQSVERAEEVGVALQALVPGSMLTTIHGRTPEYPPKALAASMAARRPQLGDILPSVIANERGDVADMEVIAVHEWAGGRRLLDVSFMHGTFIDGYGGGSVVDGEQPYRLQARSSLPAEAAPA